MSDRQLLGWEAFYRLEPWGMEFHRHAVLATLLNGNMAIQAAANGHKMNVKEFGDYMPSSWTDEAETKKDKKTEKRRLDASLKQLASAVPSPQKRRYHNGNKPKRTHFKD